MTENLNFKVDERYATDILACRSVAEIKDAAAFASYAESISGIMNGLYLYVLCRKLVDELEKWSGQYSTAPPKAKTNAS